MLLMRARIPILFVLSLMTSLCYANFNSDGIFVTPSGNYKLVSQSSITYDILVDMVPGGPPLRMLMETTLGHKV
jgi:hypothetical protein